MLVQPKECNSSDARNKDEAHKTGTCFACKLIVCITHNSTIQCIVLHPPSITVRLAKSDGPDHTLLARISNHIKS